MHPLLSSPHGKGKEIHMLKNAKSHAANMATQEEQIDHKYRTFCESQQSNKD